MRARATDDRLESIENRRLKIDFVRIVDEPIDGFRGKYFVGKSCLIDRQTLKITIKNENLGKLHLCFKN